MKMENAMNVFQMTSYPLYPEVDWDKYLEPRTEVISRAFTLDSQSITKRGVQFRNQCELRPGDITGVVWWVEIERDGWKERTARRGFLWIINNFRCWVIFSVGVFVLSNWWKTCRKGNLFDERIPWRQERDCSASSTWTYVRRLLRNDFRAPKRKQSAKERRSFYHRQIFSQLLTSLIWQWRCNLRLVIKNRRFNWAFFRLIFSIMELFKNLTVSEKAWIEHPIYERALERFHEYSARQLRESILGETALVSKEIKEENNNHF